MLRYPLLQWTAMGRSRSISGGETLKLSRGHQVAPFDVSGVPLRFAAHIEHLGSLGLQAIVQSFHRDLGHFSECKSSLFPCFDSTVQISARIFKAYSR